MATDTPKLRVKPTAPNVIDAVRSAATKSAQINTDLRKAAQAMADARQANTGSGDGSGSGAAL